MTQLYLLIEYFSTGEHVAVFIKLCTMNCNFYYYSELELR